MVVSADAERLRPVRTTRNTILGHAHRLAGVRDHQSIFHFNFSQRPWDVAWHTSLGRLGHYFIDGYPSVPMAGTLAPHWSASGAVASAYDVSDGSGMLAESSRLPVASLSWVIHLYGNATSRDLGRGRDINALPK